MFCKMTTLHPDSAVVYFNNRENVFFVVAEAMRGVAKAEIGEPIRIPESEFDSRIGAVLLEALDSFQTNVYSPDVARGGSQEESRNFIRKHLGVDVERLPSGNITVMPLHHSKGGYSGSYEEKIVVAKADIPAKIPSALREAFSLAT
jgi:hypothetical protein